jgi:hypothetical protein
MSLIVFLVYNNFQVNYQSIVNSFILLLLCKLRESILKNYKIESGTGLLYIHSLFFHIPDAIFSGLLLSKVNCEKGESMFGIFKKIIQNFTGSERDGQLQGFLQRMYFKEEMKWESEKSKNVDQKKLFHKKFKIIFEEYFDLNKFVKRDLIPEFWLQKIDSRVYLEVEDAGTIALKKDWFGKLLNLKDLSYSFKNKN